VKSKSKNSGKLRIGDDWNAIRIIALSLSNPLKAIAELVENSIDASGFLPQSATSTKAISELPAAKLFAHHPASRLTTSMC